MPALSPDGEWVVFPTTRAGGWKLWIQRPDGSEGRFLESERLAIRDVSMHPRFSPDGEWVVFTSNRSHFNDEWALTWFPQPYGDLWAVSVADGDAIRLTHNKWEDGPSDWGYVHLPDHE
jgi:Tol biopolymer transport system component